MLTLSAFSILALASTTLAFPGSSDDDSAQQPCPPGYKEFDREGGRKWCLKYFEGNQTFFEAEKICRCQGGATLSGLENHLEYKFVINEATTSFLDDSIQNGGVLLGAYRRKACRGEETKWHNKTECTPKLMFQWTDRNTVGTEVFKWMPSAPHSAIVNKVQDNCVQLLVSTETSGANFDLSGLMNNKDCNLRGSPDGKEIYVNRGFVCGRPALGDDECGDFDGSDGDMMQILIGAGKPKKE